LRQQVQTLTGHLARHHIDPGTGRHQRHPVRTITAGVFLACAAFWAVTTAATVVSGIIHLAAGHAQAPSIGGVAATFLLGVVICQVLIWSASQVFRGRCR
jgi:hypothetical protein